MHYLRTSVDSLLVRKMTTIHVYAISMRHTLHEPLVKVLPDEQTSIYYDFLCVMAQNQTHHSF